MEKLKKENGKFSFYRWIMTEAEFCRLTEEGGGLCRHCGEESWGVEPDARGLGCDACNSRSVYGAEEALLCGWIEFGGDE